jgi:hypothetical protein
MKFKPGDICIQAPGWKRGCWLIEACIPDNSDTPYHGINLATTNRFSLHEYALVKIGEIAPELTVQQAVALLLQPPPLPAETSPEYIAGQSRAQELAAAGWPEQKACWALLAKAKPGDKILIENGRKREFVIFHYVLVKGDKYVFTAAGRKGSIYRYPLDALVLEP